MPIDRDALNYPYIRIRDVEWLKKTLLLFPHVVRMTPDFDPPPDDPRIRAFTEIDGRRGPLLRSANLFSDGVWKAQEELRQRLRVRLHQDPGFLTTHGREGTLRVFDGNAPLRSVWSDRLRGQPFQIHSAKLMGPLTHFLFDEGLAWEPSKPHGSYYLEMHPRLGEAIMATLAYSCAEDEGLQLVTEFPQIFGDTIRTPRERLLESCLGDSTERRKEPQRLADLIIFHRCDTTALTPERLQALNAEWEAMAAFREAAEAMAATIPPEISNPDVVRSRLQDAASNLLAKWHRDRANLSAYAREAFGWDALKEPEKLIASSAEKIAGGAVTGALVGGLTSSWLLGAGAACAVGVVFHAARSAVKVTRRDRGGPYRYLSLMERQGVSIAISR